MKLRTASDGGTNSAQITLATGVLARKQADGGAAQRSATLRSGPCIVRRRTGSPFCPNHNPDPYPISHQRPTLTVFTIILTLTLPLHPNQTYELRHPHVARIFALVEDMRMFSFIRLWLSASLASAARMSEPELPYARSFSRGVNHALSNSAQPL